MKRYRFKYKQISIRSDSLDKILSACASLPELTRTSISERSGVSLPTAAKLLDAMDECRFTRPIYKFPQKGRSVKLHLINPSVASAVLDLSTRCPILTVIKADGSVIFHNKYDYVSDISLFDNLSSIIARACIDLKSKDGCISSLSVIVADEIKETDFDTLRFPTLQDRKELEDKIVEVFGTLPVQILSFSQAISAAVSYDRLPSSIGTNISYIYAGFEIKVCYLPKGSSPVTCLAEELMDGDSITLRERLERANTPTDMAKLLTQAVNFAHCAFAPDGYVIEYDTAKFGHISLGEIKRSFALLSRRLPELYVRDHSTGLHLKGAAASGVKLLFSKHITSSIINNNKKTSEDS